MINNLWMYAALPLAPTILCALLLHKLYRKKSDRHFIRLFANLLLMNVSQAIGYLLFSISPFYAEYAADIYLISAYFFFTHLMMTSLYLSGLYSFGENNRVFLLYSFPLALTGLHALGFIVNGYRVEQNTLMHNDGSLAWCLDAYILSSCILTVSILIKNVKRAKTQKDRMLTSRNLIALVSFFPLVFAFFVIVALSTTRYAVPVVVIGPCITFYTAFAFYYISAERTIDLSIGFRFFFDRLKLAYLLLVTHKTKSDLKAYSKAVDRQFIREALRENAGQIQLTADALQVNHTTLRNKIKEYKL